jgi:hypothetical protein
MEGTELATKDVTKTYRINTEAAEAKEKYKAISERELYARHEDLCNQYVNEKSEFGRDKIFSGIELNLTDLRMHNLTDLQMHSEGTSEMLRRNLDVSRIKKKAGNGAYTP